MGIFWEVNLTDFLLVTVFLGGGAAYPTGRAVALTWRPVSKLIVFVLLLTVAVRFIHYGLFGGTFFGVAVAADGSVSWQPMIVAVHFALVDLIVLLIVAAFAFQATRAAQMTGQYSWLYERTGRLSWRKRPLPTQ
jgi:type II secretory pathway component PulL